MKAYSVNKFTYFRILDSCGCVSRVRIRKDIAKLSYNVTYPRATKTDTKAWCALMRQPTHLRYMTTEDRLHAIYIRSGNYLPVLFALPFLPVMFQVQQMDHTWYGVASSPSWEIHIFAFFTFPIAIHSRFWPLTTSHCCCIYCRWIPVLLTNNHL